MQPYGFRYHYHMVYRKYPVNLLTEQCSQKDSNKRKHISTALILYGIVESLISVIFDSYDF